MLLLIPASKLNPAEAQAKDLPGKGDAFDGRDALDRRRHLARAC